MRPFLSLGFRPFFLGASLFACVAMAAWLAAWRFGAPVGFAGLPPVRWHGHEMVFGYAVAVMAGFLLTAARTWTGRDTATGLPLALLFGAWLLARLALFAGPAYLPLAAAADLAFLAGLIVAVTRPIVAVRQRRQAPVLFLLLFLFATQAGFYASQLGWLPGNGAAWVHAGLYGVLGMVLFIGNRIIPFFTERGVGYEVTVLRRRWNDVASSVAFLLYVPAEVLLPGGWPGALLAAALCGLNSMRVAGWYTLGIWQRPLLWSLFAAFLMINLGFLLRGLSAVTGLPALLSLHAYAVGGIGIATLAMMARVTLGHTGRDVHAPPGVVRFIGIGILTAALLRVLQPLADPVNYPLWILLAGVLWILSFAAFAVVFGPMLLRRRADS